MMVKTSDVSGMTESDWEIFALDQLAELGWKPKSGHEIAPGSGERGSWEDLHLPGRTFDALRRLNPDVPNEYLQQALVEIVAPASKDAIAENYRVHGWLTSGFRGITYIDDQGQEQTPTLRLISTDPDENDWLAANQVTIRQADLHRRFDIVLYCNGMPVVIIELKKAGNLGADPAVAHAQLQTYVHEFPMAFRYSAFVIASDGLQARYGTIFTPLHHFSPWNVDDDGAVVDPGATDIDGNPVSGLEWALFGLANQERFLQLQRLFTAFDEGADGLAKRIAKPHQYFAVNKAVGSTIEAVDSDGKAGVVWHTQGSGKSMEMELYTNRVMRHPRLLNPTVVVITDRKELDGQLFQGFQASRLLPEQPRQITRRIELREELTSRTTGGIYFTTLQKFGRSEDERKAGADHPLLSRRRNIIVIVDEAHRSHYDDLDGYARHLRDALPHATLIAFTGTPISFAERNTRDVFGDYVDVYDLTRAVRDGATVPVYFEPRLIKVALLESLSEEDLDRAADDATVGLDAVERAQLEKSVAVVNAIYGAPDRIRALAEDLVAHWEARRQAMQPLIEVPGKALIVGGTREICAHLYAAIVALRPDWHSDDLDRGVIKVVYSGDPTDRPPIRNHVRRDSENAAIKARLRDPDDELGLVIVKDMLLTGYDSPPLHTLYLDRPLKGALLMQALARVNRTFRGKDAGLLVGYAPLAENLQKALDEYTETDRTERPVGRDIEETATLVQNLLELIRSALVGFDWRAKIVPGHRKSWFVAAMATVNYLRSPSTPGNQVAEGEERLADRFRSLSAQLTRAWALTSSTDALTPLRNEVRFYEEVRVYMAKFDAEERRASGQPVPEEIQRLLAAVIADSTQIGDVVDIYEAAGIPKPELTELNPEYAAKAQQAANPQLAIEALRKAILDEAGRVTRNNVTRERMFSERVTSLMTRYTNSQLTSAEVIAELVAMAKQISEESKRGKKFAPPLDDDQLAFYDAVATNESAVLEQGDEVLAQIARELVAIMRRDVRTDWTVREDVRAKLRSSIKRLLVKYKYPPDKQPGAIKLVMEQMEQLAPRYAVAS